MTLRIWGPDVPHTLNEIATQWAWNEKTPVCPNIYIVCGLKTVANHDIMGPQSSNLPIICVLNSTLKKMNKTLRKTGLRVFLTLQSAQPVLWDDIIISKHYASILKSNGRFRIATVMDRDWDGFVGIVPHGEQCGQSQERENINFLFEMSFPICKWA